MTKTLAFDGLCHEGFHEFKLIDYSLKKFKYVMIDCKIEKSIPLEACDVCGLLRLKKGE